jgi:hypothetical protein
MPQMAARATSQHETRWSKSSFCQAGECAELAVADDGEIVLRSSRAPADVVRLTAAEWQAFVAGIKAGEFSPLP